MILSLRHFIYLIYYIKILVHLIFCFFKLFVINLFVMTINTEWTHENKSAPLDPLWTLYGTESEKKKIHSKLINVRTFVILSWTPSLLIAKELPFEYICVNE